MNFDSPLYAGLLLLVAIGTIAIFSLFRKEVVVSLRFSTIDGLRGYLALFVFIHHSSIWFSYARSGKWVEPTSNLYVHLGQSSVSLFFMITSFLFVNKLLSSKGQIFNWKKLFVSRVFRLAPLYLAAMLLLLAIVFILSNGELKNSPKYIIGCVLKWITFTGMGAPDINNVKASVITAGVTWSLPYEWIFYFILPLLWVLIGGKGGIIFLPVSIVAIGWFAYFGMNVQIALNFLGGAIAALCIRNDNFLKFSSSKIGSSLALILLVMLPIFPTAYAYIPLAILISAFCLIASGANLFGALDTKVSHALGEIAYSIYLLHGFILFAVNYLIIGTDRLSQMSSLSYFVILTFAVPALLAVSIYAFKYIEEPGIAYGKKLSLRESLPGKAVNPESA